MFKIAKKGYDINDVDCFINNLKKSYELKIGELKVINSELNAKIDEMKNSINSFEENEDSVSKAIIKAVEKADEIEYTSKVRFALEGERIKLFKERWLNYVSIYLNKISREHDIEMQRYLDDTKREVDILFQKEFHVADYFEDTSKFIE